MFPPQLLDAVRLAEAEGGIAVLNAYWDNIGKVWTIGYGHTGPDVVEGLTCTPGEAEQWLESDLLHASSNAQRLREWPDLDTDARQSAVTELVFNMGLGEWVKFLKTRAAIEAQEWATAGAELVNSAWASQVGGERSGRLRRWLETGVY